MCPCALWLLHGAHEKFIWFGPPGRINKRQNLHFRILYQCNLFHRHGFGLSTSIHQWENGRARDEPKINCPTLHLILFLDRSPWLHSIRSIHRQFNTTPPFPSQNNKTLKIPETNSIHGIKHRGQGTNQNNPTIGNNTYVHPLGHVPLLRCHN